MYDDKKLKAKHNWDEFNENIRYHNRFFVDEKFKDDLIKVLQVFEGHINKGVRYYRGRKHNFIQEDTPFDYYEMGAPPKGNTSSNKASPKGISYLYVSSSADICLQEVKPVVKNFISVSSLFLKQKIKIIDLCTMWPPLEDPYLNELAFKMNLFFQYPISPNTSDIDYIPYQFICELIKNQCYDGVKYASTYFPVLMDNFDKHNLVLFDPEVAGLNNDVKVYECISTKAEIIEHNGVLNVKRGDNKREDNIKS